MRIYGKIEEYSCKLSNYAKDLLFSSEPLSPLMKYDDTLIMSPHLFKKVAVHGICED